MRPFTRSSPCEGCAVTACSVRLRLLSGLSCFALSVFSGCAPAAGFSCWGGGSVHKSITVRALKACGVSQSSLRPVVAGNNGQDFPLTDKCTSSPERHADDSLIRETYQYWHSRVNECLEIAGRADASRAARRQALYKFGQALHALQDFYSHSNYVEWLLKEDRALAPVDWITMPPVIRSGYFYYSAPFLNEKVSGRNLSVKGLRASDDMLAFRSASEYRARTRDGSLEAAIKYALDEGDLLHMELNKDNRKSLQGRVFAGKHNKTLHDIAADLAVLDTQRQWRAFETSLADRYGERAPAILRALKGIR